MEKRFKGGRGVFHDSYIIYPYIVDIVNKN